MGRYGIPDDIIAQTDRNTLWVLVCTAEDLNLSGITGPYELHKHIHPSEVGTCVGSDMGGTESLAQVSLSLIISESGVCADCLQAVYKKISNYTGDGSSIPIMLTFAAALGLPMGRVDDGAQYVGTFVALPDSLTMTTVNRTVSIHMVRATRCFGPHTMVDQHTSISTTTPSSATMMTRVSLAPHSNSLLAPARRRPLRDGDDQYHCDYHHHHDDDSDGECEDTRATAATQRIRR